MSKKIVWVVLAVAVLSAAAVALFGERLLLAALRQQVVATLSGAKFAEFGDGLHVVLCGAGSPLPDPKRAGPCVAVIAGQRVMIVDVGSGGVRNLAPSGIPIGQVEQVFLTHFHSDHIDGLGELLLQRWAGGSRPEPLPVYGPDGVEDIVAGFNQAYRHDFGYRVAHHGPDIIPPTGAGGVAHPFATPAEGEARIVLEDGDLKVTAFAVSHAPIEPAVGYRFDYRGRSAVISGDTAKSENLARFAKGADLLVHEALAPHLVSIITESAVATNADKLAQITRDILNYHTTPVEAAEVAQQAGVRHLLYYHIVPALPAPGMDRIFLRGVEGKFDGGITVGKDRQWIALPEGSTDVKVSRR